MVRTVISAMTIQSCQAWVSLPRLPTSTAAVVKTTSPTDILQQSAPCTTSRHHFVITLQSAATAATADSITEDGNDDDHDDDEEYEYIEYEDLAESDFIGSEWRVGTCWDNNPNRIDETWSRLEIKADKNVAVWGDNSKGSWNFDVPSQFLTISKEFLWGKKIWAGVVDDYYFLRGTVRGWTYVTAAAVEGQWQAMRLGVDPEEAGTPPWFEVEEEETEVADPTTEMAATAATEEKVESKTDASVVEYPDAKFESDLANLQKEAAKFAGL